MEVHTQRSTVARFPELTHRARIPLKLTKMFPNKGMNEAYNAYNKHRLYIHRGNKSQKTLLAAQNERTLKRKRGGATQHMPRLHQKLH